MKGLIACLTFFYVILGWVLGDLNFWFNMYPFYAISHLATYHDINPSLTHVYDLVGKAKPALLPTQGKRYQDAGKIYFSNANIKVDRSRAMSFKNHDTFCVAPIVDTTCHEGCGYDFWAVGINCCGTDDQVNFWCGISKEAQEDETNIETPKAIRFVDNHDKPFFRLAVTEAEGIHGIQSKHPIFVEFLENKTPERRIIEFATTGYTYLVVSVFIVFVVNFVTMIVLAKKIPELSHSSTMVEFGF